MEGSTPKPFVDLSDEEVHLDLSEHLSYSQYLNLDKLLDAQHPLSYHHDEMLFIVIHPGSELWMKIVPARVEFDDRLRAAGRSGPNLQDARTRVDHSNPAAAVLGRPGHDHTIRLFRIPQYLGRSSGFQSPSTGCWSS